jgi:hypothetical protein
VEGVDLRKKYWGLIAAAVTACAVMEPPTGGPEDKIPPKIVKIVPSPDSAGVARNSPIRISFSEKLGGDSFKNRVDIYPRHTFDRVEVEGDRLEISFSELLPETTFCVLLKSGYKDNHNVASKENFIFHFATTGEIQTGRISGTVMYKSKPDSNGIVKLYEIRTDTFINFQKELESRIAFCSRMGAFSFEALPADSSRFVLWAFTDSNDDGLFTAGQEFSALFPDTVLLTSRNRGVEDLSINIIDPNEPGSVTGRIINETGINLPVTVLFTPVLPGERRIVAVADSTGHFTMKLPPGGYLIQAFVDVAADSACSEYPQPEDSTVMLREPCLALPDTLVVKPGEPRNLEPATLEIGEIDDGED